MSAQSPKNLDSLSYRYVYGSLTVPEVLWLAGVSKSKFYGDVRKGLVSTYKRGGQTLVAGPAAAAYCAGPGNLSGCMAAHLDVD